MTAGYLPAAPEVIVPQLMANLHDGEALLPVPGSPLHVLWRKSMLDPAWTQGYGITIVDFSSETFGLAAHLFWARLVRAEHATSFVPSRA